MNYATWKLDFSDPQYGTGPEQIIFDLGFKAEASWVSGEIENGGTILGYITEPQDESALSAWSFKNLTPAEALAFCQAINPNAYMLEDGKITASVEELDTPSELGA
jgi:hypothetical protein